MGDSPQERAERARKVAEQIQRSQSGGTRDQPVEPVRDK